MPLLSRLWIRALGFSSSLCMGRSEPDKTSVSLRSYRFVECKLNCSLLLPRSKVETLAAKLILVCSVADI